MIAISLLVLPCFLLIFSVTADPITYHHAYLVTDLLYELGSPLGFRWGIPCRRRVQVISNVCTTSLVWRNKSRCRWLLGASGRCCVNELTTFVGKGVAGNTAARSFQKTQSWIDFLTHKQCLTWPNSGVCHLSLHHLLLQMSFISSVFSVNFPLVL